VHYVGNLKQVYTMMHVQKNIKHGSVLEIIMLYILVFWFMTPYSLAGC